MRLWEKLKEPRTKKYILFIKLERENWERGRKEENFENSWFNFPRYGWSNDKRYSEILPLLLLLKPKSWLSTNFPSIEFPLLEMLLFNHFLNYFLTHLPIKPTNLYSHSLTIWSLSHESFQVPRLVSRPIAKPSCPSSVNWLLLFCFH